MKKRMKKITKSKQKHLAKTYKKHLVKTYKKHKKHLRKTYKKHKFFLQKGGMDPPDPPVEPDTCPICLEPLRDSPIIITDCQHKFHNQCLQEWILTRRPTCPLCRAPVDPGNAMRTQIMREELAWAERRPEASIRRACILINASEVMRVSVMLEAGIINANASINYLAEDVTLLHFAAYRGKMQIVKELLLRGASARALSSRRRETPAQLVRRVRSDRFREIAAFLEAAERVEIDAEAAAAAARVDAEAAAAAAAARDDAELAMAASTPISSTHIDDDDL
jgi:hypothetical protein